MKLIILYLVIAAAAFYLVSCSAPRPCVCEDNSQMRMMGMKAEIEKECRRR